MGVYKRGKNWCIRFEYDGKDLKKMIGTDRREAELAYAEIKNEIRLAKLSEQGWDGFKKLQKANNPKTFAEAAQDYMDERTNFKASTIASYKSILKKHLLPKFGSQTLKSITDSQLKKFASNLNKTASASRVNTVLQLMRSILDQEQRQGEIDRDPSRAVKRVEEPKAEIDPLSETDLALALSHIDVHYQPVFMALAYTGARPNEIIALRWSDIDWRNESIKISKGRVRGVEGLPKTRAGQRVIKAMPQVIQALNMAKEQAKARAAKRVVIPMNKDQAQPELSSDGYIFTKPDGAPIDKHLDRIWARALKKAGLRHRPSYQLRHTFVTQCIIKGLPLPFIAKMIGHSTIDVLIRHYAGWIESETNDYEKKLQSAFAPVDLTNVLSIAKAGTKLEQSV
jgi:integrase